MAAKSLEEILKARTQSRGSDDLKQRRDALMRGVLNVATAPDLEADDATTFHIAIGALCERYAKTRVKKPDAYNADDFASIILSIGKAELLELPEPDELDEEDPLRPRMDLGAPATRSTRRAQRAATR